MKKRLIALAMGVLMTANLAPTMTASAANNQKTELKMPKTQTKTFILPAENISTPDSVGDVKVEVTYTGWLGEIDAKENGLYDSIGSNNWITGPNADHTKIAVMKEGSEIRFKITSNDPSASYNFCYDKIAYDPGYGGEDTLYGWDDCGGGYIYYNAKNEGFPVQVYGQPDGTSILRPGPFHDYFTQGRKISANEYSYKVANGLMEYTFQSKYPRDDDNAYNPNDYVCRYFLGTVLAINEEQVKELEETGTMTFLKGVKAMGEQSVEYQHVYKGLPELLGLSAPQNPQLRITNYQGVYAYGHTYDYTITNNTGKEINAYYGLLFYKSKAYDEGKYGINWGNDFYTFHLTLDPNESVSGVLATDSLLAQYESPIWIRFDSQQALWDFIPDTGHQSQADLFKMYSVGKFTPEWMKETFGIEIPVVQVG